jgi:MFS transporter, ACS family, tartrate transporter
VRHSFTDPKVLKLSAVYFALLVALYGYGFWLPQVVAALGSFSHRQVGVLTMLPNLVAAACMYPWGRHGDSSGDRRWHTGAPLVLAAGGLTVAGGVHQAAIAIAALTVAAVVIYCSLPAYWSLPVNYLGGASAAAGLALINSVGSIGGYVGPSALGYLRQASGTYMGGMFLMTASLLIAGLIVFSTKHASISAGRADPHR